MNARYLSSQKHFLIFFLNFFSILLNFCSTLTQAGLQLSPWLFPPASRTPVQSPISHLTLLSSTISHPNFFPPSTSPVNNPHFFPCSALLQGPIPIRRASLSVTVCECLHPPLGRNWLCQGSGWRVNAPNHRMDSRPNVSSPLTTPPLPPINLPNPPLVPTIMLLHKNVGRTDLSEKRFTGKT